MDYQESLIDWSECDLVERVPGKVSGVPILKHSRVPADTVVDNYEGGLSAEEISYQFSLPLEQVNAVLNYAARMSVDAAS